MTDDLVQRLRDHSLDEGTDERLLKEAAFEIESKRAELESAADDLRSCRAEIARLNDLSRTENLRFIASIERLVGVVGMMADHMPDEDPEEADANNEAFRRGDGEDCQREAC